MSTISDGARHCPAAWASAGPDQKRFFTAIHRARRPLLMCDYDGTLAPFQSDKMQAYPHGGVTERLTLLRESGTELAFVSGRPVDELLRLLPLADGNEIWGMHGREHQSANGKRTLLEPNREQRAALDAAETALTDRGWKHPLLERKIGSLAMHWRTLAPADGQGGGQGRTQSEARADAEQVFNAIAGRHAMAVLAFDGGLELRTEDRTKAHAVEALLAAADPRAAAFLGDDLTDEDGFRAIRALGGLALLVRAEPRASAARFFLRTPAELLGFFDTWIGARVQAHTDSPSEGAVV